MLLMAPHMELRKSGFIFSIFFISVFMLLREDLFSYGQLRSCFLYFRILANAFSSFSVFMASGRMIFMSNLSIFIIGGIVPKAP